MIKKEKKFVGEFKELLESFIKEKRILGYKYNTTRESLIRFSQYTLDCPIKNKCLSKEVVLGWTARRDNESVKTMEHRASDLRQFALYLENHGYNAFIPQKSHKIRRDEYIPYIFTHDEIKRFMQVVDSITPHPLSNKHATYPLLFRLLYCCGLRISEVLRLKISDVDFDRGTVFIRESKFNKDRIVPMSDPLIDMFVKYHNVLNKNNVPGNYFLRNKNGTPLTHKRIYEMYRKFLWNVEISHGGKGKGPRLHDLRHTFCVHSLAKQVNDGVDLYVALPILSVYIGHSSVGATQRYLRLTAEAYPELIDKVSRTCSYIFPEVSRDEIN